MRIHHMESIPTDYPQTAYLANGLIGLRVPFIPVGGGVAYLNGFVGSSPERVAEEYAPAPYPLGLDVIVQGARLSQWPERFVFVSQAYDFRQGELESRFDVCLPGGVVRVTVTTFCSRTMPAICAQSVELSTASPLEITLVSGLRYPELGQLRSRMMPRRQVDASITWESRHALGTAGAAYLTEHAEADAVIRNDFGHEQEEPDTYLTFRLDGKTPRGFRVLAALVPSSMHAEPELQAIRLVKFAGDRGFDTLRTDNRAAWEELWKGRPVLHGAGAEFQDYADAAFFYLHSSGSVASAGSVAPFGLSRRKEYSGHVFWDTDFFMLPTFSLTAPETAETLLDYRFRRLDAARDNARLNGLPGAFFPWQSGQSGSEVSSFYHGCAAEIHGALDTAMAFLWHAAISGDDAFTRERAWPVVSGVADWISARAVRTGRGYALRDVVGIWEGRGNVHNESFTNMMAVRVLRLASDMAGQMGYRVSRRWQAVAEGMVFSMIPGTDILNVDGDFACQPGAVCIPAPLAGIFPGGFHPAPEVERATLSYYAERFRTCAGSPMLSGLMGTWAAWTGDRALSLEFFRQGALGFRVEPFHQFTEKARALAAVDINCNDIVSTVFLTNPAGFLLSCYLGLPGLEISGSDPLAWPVRPVILPEGWDGIEVERLWVRGDPMRLVAEHGAPQAQLIPLSQA